MVKFLQLYKENIGKTVTRTIIGALIGTLITLGGYLIFDSFPEKKNIENEFYAHFEKMDTDSDKIAKISEHLHDTNSVFDNFSNRIEFILTLSQRFEHIQSFHLTSNEKEKINIFFRQNLLDSGLNSAIVEDYKMDEDKNMEDALTLEKQILRRLNEKPTVDKSIYNMILDYIIVSHKMNSFVILNTKRLQKDIKKQKSDDKFKKEFEKIEEKFKRNANLQLAATESLLLCSFLLVFLIFIAVKVGHLRE